MRRTHPTHPEPSDLPDPTPGVTVVRTDGPAAGAFARLVTDWLADDPGPAYWVDAGGAADTRRLYEATPTRRALAGLRVARAFTAYQHATLLRRVARTARPGTRLLAVPNADYPYRAGDAPDDEARRLRRAGVTLLSELADALDCRVVVSVGGDDDHASAFVDDADRVVDCEATPFGTRFDAPDHVSRGYHVAGWWQTTIPYWVDLLGAGSLDRAVSPATTPMDATAGSLGPSDAVADGGG